MELLGYVGHLGSRFGPFGDSLVSVHDGSTVCAEHTVGLEIILDAPDGNPR
jgi:hypothetical protein